MAVRFQRPRTAGRDVAVTPDRRARSWVAGRGQITNQSHPNERRPGAGRHHSIARWLSSSDQGTREFSTGDYFKVVRFKIHSSLLLRTILRYFENVRKKHWWRPFQNFFRTLSVSSVIIYACALRLRWTPSRIRRSTVTFAWCWVVWLRSWLDRSASISWRAMYSITCSAIWSVFNHI